MIVVGRQGACGIVLGHPLVSGSSGSEMSRLPNRLMPRCVGQRVRAMADDS